MIKRSPIILSFSDIWLAIKEARWLILSSAVFFGVLLFGYYLLKPPSYTAEGIFKGEMSSNMSNFSKALEFLEAGESYSSSDDPVIFLQSYPVMEEVARSLHLQLTIHEHKKSSRLKQIWHTLKAERAQRQAKIRVPSSDILRVPVVSKPILPDPETSLYCLALNYPGDTSCHFELFFPDERHFQVKQKSRIISEGEIGKPFQWDGGSFTLDSLSSVEGKTFSLTFIPLHAAAISLEKSLSVKRSKDHSSLVYISFTHSNRHLATNIVNGSMRAFQKYLKEDGKRKIAKQLSYLEKRQQETGAKLEHVMEEHIKQLEEHIDSGAMFLLEHELEFMFEKQSKARRNLEKVASEMLDIHFALTSEKELSLVELLERLRSRSPPLIQPMTVEGIKKLILDHEQSLDLVKLEQEQYDYCLTKLKEPNFDTSSLSNVIDDSTLTERFEKIHTLQRNIIDEKNWTARERMQLQESLETERRFLSKHIVDLKAGAFLRDDIISKRLHELNEGLLFLLLDQYEGVEKKLQDLASRAAHFPQKWLNEHKIKLNSKWQTEMIESITKMIEAKNLGFHLDHLSATPLKPAIVPMIPNSPRLFFGFLLGTFFGVFLLLASVIFREIWLGPRASYSNFKSENRAVISFSHTMDDLKKILYHLKKSGPFLTVLAKNPSFACDLHSLFSRSGEQVLLIELETLAENPFVEKIRKELNLKKSKNLKESFLTNARFQEKFKEISTSFDRIILSSQAPLKSLETRVLLDLADQTVILLRDERWKDLPELPEKTLFVTEHFQNKAFALRQIVPFLERVISFSSWSKQRIEEPQQTESHVP